MAFNDGWNGFFSLANSSGTVVDLTSYIVSLDDYTTTDMNESTTWSNGGNRSFRPGLSGGKITIKFRRDPAVDAVMRNPRTPAAGRAFVLGMDGNGSGATRKTGYVLLPSYKRSADFESMQESSVELLQNGAVTEDTFP